MLVPGEALASPLFLAVTREHEDDWSAMPPKANDKLSAEQVGYVKQWIAAGAPWPDAKRIAVILKHANPWGETEGVTVKTSGGLDDGWTNRKYDPEKLWAYQPVKKPAVPGKGHPIDAFIGARLPEGLDVGKTCGRGGVDTACDIQPHRTAANAEGDIRICRGVEEGFGCRLGGVDRSAVG